jgi:hypothetical protein
MFSQLIPTPHLRAISAAILLLVQTVSAQGTWRVGDHVEAGFGTSAFFQPGVITEIGPRGYRVHYDGYGAAYDDWVSANRIRRAGTKQAAPPAPAPAAATPTAPPKAPPLPDNSGKPPCQVGMVVRAGALNYDAKIVAIDAAKTMYKVQYVTGYKGDVEYLFPRDLKTCYAPDPAPVPEPWFIGVWQLSVGGGGAWAKNPVTGSWKVTALNVAGAPPIRISADGTYEWIIDQKQVVTGQWRRAAKSELKYGYEQRGTALILLKGEDGKNWLVTRQLTGNSDGRDRILLERQDLGLTYWGNRVSNQGR